MARAVVAFETPRIDSSLIRIAQIKATGATIHKLAQVLTIYQCGPAACHNRSDYQLWKHSEEQLRAFSVGGSL